MGETGPAGPDQTGRGRPVFFRPRRSPASSGTCCCAPYPRSRASRAWLRAASGTISPAFSGRPAVTRWGVSVCRFITGSLYLTAALDPRSSSKYMVFKGGARRTSGNNSRPLSPGTEAKYSWRWGYQDTREIRERAFARRLHFSHARLSSREDSLGPQRPSSLRSATGRDA